MNKDALSSLSSKKRAMDSSPKLSAGDESLSRPKKQPQTQVRQTLMNIESNLSDYSVGMFIGYIHSTHITFYFFCVN